MPLRVLVGCEMSGRVRDEFAKRGWEAWSADLLPSESPDAFFRNGGSAMHYQGDVRDLFRWDHPVNAGRMAAANEQPVIKDIDGTGLTLWDLCIMHPPCNDISYVGARWFKQKQIVPSGKAKSPQQEGIDFFMKMLKAPSPLVAVENPHSIVQRPEHAGPPTQSVQPWHFGDPRKKRIDLWLKGLPKLVPTDPVEPTGRVTTGGGSWRTDQAAGRLATSAHEDSEGRARRAIVRSRTSTGLAQAMARQWGSFAEEHYREPGQ